MYASMCVPTLGFIRFLTIQQGARAAWAYSEDHVASLQLYVFTPFSSNIQNSTETAAQKEPQTAYSW